ncbi:unnamed protein product [Cyprideis torosa]|uniref:phosphatidylinositol-3,5-bisphosphate 3-phosphatase n=1 Tax=Cyprideis torosa TaxID=163714 RepID=A0A7R8WF26_9CRUS|nr:unnamed protein product [Cyprideis torosa]CAG0896499.1 unnamed protein product [Cyprideis torosa]
MDSSNCASPAPDDSVSCPPTPKPDSTKPSPTEEAWPLPLVVTRQRTQSSSTTSSWSYSSRPVQHSHPHTTERQNLLSLLRLVVQDLLESSMKQGRTLDSEQTAVQDFFVVLEHILRHGFGGKHKRSLLGPRKGLWDLLQEVEIVCPSAKEITDSARQLPNVRTGLGRVRAWLQLALMQKHLADYISVLIEKRVELLPMFYEDYAILRREDDALAVLGLVMGINTVDFNLIIKGEDLDTCSDVVDLSQYLRSSSTGTLSRQTSLSGPLTQSDEDAELKKALDQKNYVEELNRKLLTNCENLRAKVKGLTDDLDKARKGAGKMGGATGSHGPLTDEPIGELDFQVKFEEERFRREQLERELLLLSSVKTEMEVAMKLLEKDIHEKQDTMVSLRRQLEDIKHINLELYKKLQMRRDILLQEREILLSLDRVFCPPLSSLDRHLELHPDHASPPDTDDDVTLPIEDAFQDEEEREGSMRHKVEVLQKVDSKNAVMGETIRALEDKYEREGSMRHKVEVLQKVDSKNAVMGETIRALEDKLVTLETQKRELETRLTRALEGSEGKDQLLDSLQEDLRIEREWRERLQVDDLQELTSSIKVTHWAKDSDVKHCRSCQKEFSITRRKHHCRVCGHIFCALCSDNFHQLPSAPKPARCCDACFQIVNSPPAQTELMSRFSSLHRPVILGMSKVPDRWNRYSPHGTPVRGTPFVPFKVPLSDAANVKLPHYARWSVEDLLTAFPKIKTIIDLTGRNYYHYVEPDQARKSTFRKQYGVRLEKLSFTVGFPSREQLGFFFRIIDEHIDEFGEDSQIGIHCTHGVNRTGFMVCRYMIERNRVNASDAIKAFNAARGHALEREYYLKRLQDVSEIFAKSSSSDSIKSKKLQQQLEALEAQSKAENSSQRFCFNGFNQSATQLMMALSIKKNFSEKLHSELSNASLTNLCYRDEPLVIVILATWRSGSTFLASLIREIPGTFYSFEPFHSLRSGLVNRGTLGDAHNIFKAIVDCDFRMSQKYLNHVHRTKWLAAHNKRYDDVCNSSKTLCFNAAFYSDVCSQFPIRLVKIVRLKVTQFITFLEGRRKSFENWRVIQLFRDPRGLFSSRKDEVIWKWCSKNPSCSNSKIACQNLLEDYRLGQEKLKVIFGTERFMVLKYEDLALHPQVTAESLLSFLGFRKPFPKSVMDFVTLNTSRDYLNSKEDSRYSVARNCEASSGGLPPDGSIHYEAS